jgi:aryl-alcohol dehydrogenase-like predicted oxidoreductase
MDYIELGNVRVSRFILGSNPFSGFSHQGPEMDLAMKRYYTTETIKETIRRAEALGINTLIGRTDHHHASSS